MVNYAIYDLTLRSSPDLPIQLKPNIKPTPFPPIPAASSPKDKHDKTANHKEINNYMPAIQIPSTSPGWISQKATHFSTPTNHTDLSSIDRSETLNKLRRLPCIPESPLARNASLDDLFRHSGGSSPIGLVSSRNGGYDGDCDELMEEINTSIEYKQPPEREMDIHKIARNLKCIHAELRRNTRLLRLTTRMHRRVGWKRARPRFPRISKRLRT